MAVFGSVVAVFRGYAPSLSGNRESRFDRIEMVVELDCYAPRLIIKPADLKQYKDRIVLLYISGSGLRMERCAKISANCVGEN